MTPRWLTIDKLVVELGGVCTSEYELRGGGALAVQDVRDAVGRATQAVGAVLSDRAQDDDEVVRTAWQAIGQAQDVIARLRETVERSRSLRERAQWLQTESVRLRHARSRGRSGSVPAQHRTDPD